MLAGDSGPDCTFFSGGVWPGKSLFGAYFSFAFLPSSLGVVPFGGDIVG